MESYIFEIADQKKKLTLQNMPTLIKRGLIPEEYAFEEKLFNFNKFLKKNKDGDYYYLDEYSRSFFEDHFNIQYLSKIEGVEGWILQKVWDKIYKQNIEGIRPFINDPITLKTLNKSLFDEVNEKYAAGSVSKWEMDSIGFYYHDHELNQINTRGIDVVDFDKLNEEPSIERTFTTKNGQEIFIYELNRVMGTVIGKDKLKNIVTLLTPTGVVKVKVYRSQFAKYDRQIADKDEETGKKTVCEKSWFTRGNKMIVTGIRRGDFFVPKAYKNTPYAPFELITNINYRDGSFNIKKNREEE